MENLSTINIIKNSIKFSFSNMGIVIGFGIIITILNFLKDKNEIFNQFPLWLYIIILVSLIFFAIIEAGFCYRIIESTLRKENSLPEFDNITFLLKDGITDLIVTVIYFGIQLILFKIFIHLMEYEFISMYLAMLLTLTVIDFIWYMALINLTCNNGKFSSAFCLKDIFHLLKNLKPEHLVIIFIIDIIEIFLLELNFTIKYPNTTTFLLLIISNLLIIPFLIIFTKRFSTIASLRIKDKKNDIMIKYCPKCGKKIKKGSIRCLKCGFYFVELEKVSKNGIIPNTFENKQNKLNNLTQNGLTIKYPSYYKNAQLPKNDPECVIALAKEDGYCDIIIDIGDMHINYIETKFEKEYKEYLMNMGYFNIIIHKGFGFKRACFETEIKSNLGIIKSIILIDFSKEKDIRITANSLKEYDYNSLNDLKIIINNLIIN